VELSKLEGKYCLKVFLLPTLYSSIEMPQGGSGNQGGNLFSSGSSKKKMSQRTSKQTTTRRTKMAAGAGGAGEEEAGAGPAYSIHAPHPEMRADLLRAQLDEDVKRRSLLTFGAPGGVALGGAGTLNGSEEEARLARVQYLERQNNALPRHRLFVDPVPRFPYAASTQQRHLIQTQQAALDVAALPAVRHRRSSARQGHENGGDAASSRRQPVAEESQEQQAQVVEVLLSMLAQRLGNELVHRTHELLLKVLTNATVKGEADPKYMRLKGSNATIFTHLMMHPEVVAVLELGCFDIVASETVNVELELGQAQVGLKQILETASCPDPTIVEGMMAKLEQLTIAASRPRTVEAAEVSRDTDMIHSGRTASMLDLARVRQLVISWGEKQTNNAAQLTL